MKEGFLKEYLEADQEEPKEEIALRDQAHETPVHGELNTISEDFQEEETLLLSESDMCKQWCPYRRGDLIIHQSPLSASRASTWKMWFLTRMIQWWYLLSLLEGRCTESWLIKGARLMWCSGDQVEIRWYVELRTTFFDDIAIRMITIRYIVVNTSFAYNLFFGWPSQTGWVR